MWLNNQKGETNETEDRWISLKAAKKLITNCIVVEHITISKKSACLVIWELFFIF